MKKTFAVLTALALGVAGCGGDDGGDGASSDSELVAPMAESIEADGGFSEEEADCIAQDVVANVGEDRLTELGVTPENAADFDPSDNLEAEDLEKVVDSLEACVDLEAMMVEQMTADGMSEDDAECLVGELDLRELFLTASDSDGFEDSSSDFQNDFIDAMAECDIAL